MDCKEFEQMLQEGSAPIPEDAVKHARECFACHQDWQVWQEIADAAPGLRKEWASPGLWPHIRQSLVWEFPNPIRDRWWRISAQQPLWRRWQAVAAVVVMLVVSGGGWMMLRQPKPVSLEAERRLLTERALSDIERDESAYLRSIDQLSRLAAPKVEQPRSALLTNYREKLLLIDSAIGELRSSIEQNRFNAHLRRELLEIYQEKQRTLEAVIKDEAHEN